MIEIRPENLQTTLLRKSKESAEAQQRFFAEQAGSICRCAVAMAQAFDRGARLFTMGNGGSACDAQHLAVEFTHPIIEKRPALPAQALGAEIAFLTAVGNDEDFSLAFARQLKIHARAGDIALGISTSGKSRNVIRGLQAARKLGLCTVGFSGRDGGRFAELCDFSFVASSFNIHRIQETHVVLMHALWDLIHVVRGEEDVL